MHVSKQSTIPDHCRAYALSDPKDKDYQSICEHDHLETCDRCELLASVLDDIDEALQKMSSSNIASDIIEELTFIVDHAKQHIFSWKAHLLRCINQDEARLDVIDGLDETSVVLVQDWAMKVLPRKLDSVSVISNIEYSSESLRVWRAYGIGTGKKIPRAKLDVSQVEQFLNHVECDSNPANGTREAYFHKFKSRAKSSLEDAAKNSDTEAEPATNASSCPLFSCPEEGCIKTYQRFSALQHHQDCGKHERALEHETLLDKAVYGYADRLQEQSGGVPQMEEFTKSRNVSNQPHLPMGWALKSSQVRRARFTEKQKDYLSSKFFFGESTGQKVDAASVSKSMMTARDSNGSRLFTSSEFLTSQQISSFFSRLASKRSQDQATDSDNELEDQNVENEEAFSDLRSEILRDVALVHPICYDNHNLCELIANSKLSKFAIQMLRNICEHFDNPTADVIITKKAPYIERTVAFGKKCTCQG